MTVVAASAHGLGHTLGNIVQRPVVGGQHAITELFLIGTQEAAYDISEFELWLSHDRPLP
jgi:hypothetical protein